MSNNSSNTYIIKNKSIASFNEDYKLIIRGALEAGLDLGKGSGPLDHGYPIGAVGLDR